ncbi:hypothetical protein M0R04_13510 [Candidatus Dojkabacteria bacterium]|jgi:hypothetical protein|nr:hypothetical protein [Candidatus Dojkabacteria bacterium]
MKIGVVLATRGFVFTEVIQALLRELEGYEYQIHMSHNLPIPDCQNVLVEEALADGADYVLFVEEDVVIPEGAIDDMMMEKGDIVAIDYGVNEWSCITKYKDEILWCGLGCTLVKREVFEGMERPYFRSDKALLLNDWPQIKWIDAGAQAYGGQDIYFCMQARDKGFKIKQVFGEARHLKLEGLGRPEINNGLRPVVDKPKISKHNKL